MATSGNFAGNDAAQRVSLGFGKCNLKISMATIAALRVKPPFVRESAVTSGVRRAGTMTGLPVSNHPEINGVMHRDYATHPNGTILMFQSSWKRGGAGLRDGCILLQLRANAALLNVTALLPHGNDSHIGDTFSVFQGNADILSVEEAAVHRIVIPPRFVDQFFSPDEVNECFTIEEIRTEVTPMPAMALVATRAIDGTVHVVTQEIVPGKNTAPDRRMRFRKPPGGAGDE